MRDAGERVSPERVIHPLVGDCTVLCVVIATREKIVIVVNAGYSHALKHAERHIANGNGEGVWICGPECSGS